MKKRCLENVLDEFCFENQKMAIIENMKIASIFIESFQSWITVKVGSFD